MRNRIPPATGIRKCHSLAALMPIPHPLSKRDRKRSQTTSEQAQFNVARAKPDPDRFRHLQMSGCVQSQSSFLLDQAVRSAGLVTSLYYKLSNRLSNRLKLFVEPPHMTNLAKPSNFLTSTPSLHSLDDSFTFNAKSLLSPVRLL